VKGVRLFILLFQAFSHAFFVNGHACLRPQRRHGYCKSYPYAYLKRRARRLKREPIRAIIPTIQHRVSRTRIFTGNPTIRSLIPLKNLGTPYIFSFTGTVISCSSVDA